MRELIIPKKISRLLRHLIPATFSVFRIFVFILLFPIKCQRTNLFTLSCLTILVNVLGIFCIYGNKLQDFCSVKCIFRWIFSPFQQFVTLNFHEIFGTFSCCDFLFKIILIHEPQRSKHINNIVIFYHQQLII